MVYKVILSEQVKKKMKKMTKEDRDGIKKCIAELAKNPLKGNLLDPISIETKPWEKCECGDPYYIFLDKNSNEVYFNCYNHKCDGFWRTKKEFDRYRKIEKKLLAESMSVK